MSPPTPVEADQHTPGDPKPHDIAVPPAAASAAGSTDAAPDPEIPARALAPRRSRKFAIPDPAGHRVEEKIEAFLEGPPVRPAGRGRHATPHPTPHPTVPIRAERLDHPLKLDSRADWIAVLGLEAARHARYARPAAVAVIEVVVLDEAGGELSRMAVDAIAGSLAQLLRASMRETDRIARMGPTRFNVLLPETTRAEARRFAERARRAGELAFTRESLRLVLKIAIAAPGREETLSDALATAEAELAR